MLDLTTRPTGISENFESVKGLLATFGPEALTSRREDAFRAFQIMGFPTMRDEEFKYVSLRFLEEGHFGLAYGATVGRGDVEKTPLGKLEAITISFVNGEHALEVSTDDILPAGVYAGNLQDAFLLHEDLILSTLGQISSMEGRLGTTNDERFVHLNTAFLGEGAFVYIPRNVVLERPIHIQYLSQADHGPFAAHPRTLIVLEEGAQAKIVESYVGLGGVYFNNAVTEISVGDGAILEHTKFQLESPDAVHVANVSIHQAATSTFTSNIANFGGKIVRNDINAWVDGEHTETWLNGVNVGLGNQVIDNHTRIDHAKPNCHSFEVYKSVLDDKAVGVFNGKIFVYLDAQKTDAKQTNQAILLSDQATMNTKPQLEIFADDVKCTHGATIGQLRDDALFYMRAHGVPKRQAEALLIYAFAAEVVDKVTLEPVREALETLLFERLQTGRATGIHELHASQE